MDVQRNLSNQSIFSYHSINEMIEQCYNIVSIRLLDTGPMHFPNF